MNGTVLHISEMGGIILGEDGERYSFAAGDVESPNLGNGTKVNFIIEEKQAREIYSIGGAAPADAPVQGAELKTAVSIAGFGALFSLIGSVSLFFAFVGFCIELYGIYLLALYKKQMDFFWYKVKAVAALLMAIVAGSFAVIGGLVGMAEEFGRLGAGPALMVIAAAVAGIYSIYAMFRSLYGIAQVYDAPLFRAAAWLYLVGMMTLIFGIGFVILLAYEVLLIVAYFTIGDRCDR